MKKILTLSFFIVAATLYSQNIADYKYIYVPQKFDDDKANRHGLNELLAKKLAAKKYIIVREASEFNCDGLKADLIDTSNMFKNKAQITFTDCNNKMVATLEGKSSIKELDLGMQDAVDLGVRPIAVSSPKNHQTSVANKIVSVTVENNTANNNEANSSIAKAASFSNGTFTMNRIFIDENQFILLIPNNSVPFATFKSSTKKEVFHVKLPDGTHTLGYFENGNIIIELPNSDGSFRKEIFIAK